MKRFILSCLVLLSMVSSAAYANSCVKAACAPSNTCEVNATSRSFLYSRPLFQSWAPEMVSGFRDSRLHDREDGKAAAAELVILGSKSTNEDDLARYFFPNGKTDLLVNEQIGALVDQDLLAQHFNIFTKNGTFSSAISIRPTQAQVGAGFYLAKSFCVDEEKGRGFFASLSFPVVSVRNNLNFHESVTNDGGGAQYTNPSNHAQVNNTTVVANMTEAFQQTDWAFGKITPCQLKKTGVADVELKLGYEWLQHDPYHLETYLGIKVPTGNKVRGEYLFEPIVGNGHHWGIMFGNAMGVHIWRDEAKSRSLRMEINTHSQYLFNAHQCRAVDLVNKPWSRYIQMYDSEAQANLAEFYSETGATQNTALAQNLSTPGINVLTLPLKVRPGFSHNTTTALVLRSDKFQIEGGWNMFCRQAECAKLACPWVEGPAIKDQAGLGQTSPVRDITGNFRLEDISPTVANNLMQLQNYKFNVIKESDLDLVSATTPNTLTYTVYGTLGYNLLDRNYPLFGNIGGSYEFGHGTNAVIERWVFWAKGGVSF